MLKRVNNGMIVGWWECSSAEVPSQHPPGQPPSPPWLALRQVSASVVVCVRLSRRVYCTCTYSLTHHLHFLCTSKLTILQQPTSPKLSVFVSVYIRPKVLDVDYGYCFSPTTLTLNLILTFLTDTKVLDIYNSVFATKYLLYSLLAEREWCSTKFPRNSAHQALEVPM